VFLRHCYLLFSVDDCLVVMNLYTVLRCRWCNIIVMNVHAPSEEKSNYSKDSFHDELE